MTSKEKILASIRQKNIVENVNLPSYDNFGITFEDKFAQFCKVLEDVGGKALYIQKEKLDETVKKLYPKVNVITSNVDEFSLANFDANGEEDVHNLKDVELCVVKGNFAVAENAAVWLKNKDNRHRVLYFICEHIVIVVNKKNIVNNMHEAYKQIVFEKAGFGVFVSGPSKTADIEQSLVIGAHGPKTAYVIFID